LGRLQLIALGREEGEIVKGLSAQDLDASTMGALLKRGRDVHEQMSEIASRFNFDPNGFRLHMFKR
jgi:hypothetical protein